MKRKQITIRLSDDALMAWKAEAQLKNIPVAKYLRLYLEHFAPLPTYQQFIDSQSTSTKENDYHDILP